VSEIFFFKRNEYLYSVQKKNISQVNAVLLNLLNLTVLKRSFMVSTKIFSSTTAIN